MQDKIFNIHAHIYPGKIADKAVGAIGKFYDIEMDLDGTPEGLIEDGRKNGCTHFAVCSVATTPAQVHSINAFIASECEKHPEFTGLGTLHPDVDDIYAQVEEMQNLGLKGIKLHPDFQKFNIDDKTALPVYDAAQQMNLPVLFHTGDDRTDFSAPERLKKITSLFPRLTVIAAHLGGYRVWDRAECLIGCENVFFDTSSALMFISPQKASDIIHRHGADRVMFGTDYPMWTHAGEKERFAALGLTDEEKSKILWENAADLFNIT